MKKWHVLTLRDFVTSREKMILIAIVFLLEIPFCLTVGDSLIWVYIMIYILAIMGMFTDDDQGISRLFASMPVSRKTWVTSRYAASLLTVGISMAVMVAESWVFFHVDLFEPEGGMGFSGLFSIHNFFLGFFLVLLFMAVSFPFYFKWGYSRGMTLGAVASAGVMGLFIGIFYVVMGIRHGIWGTAPYIGNQEGSRLAAFLAGVGTRAFHELGSAAIGIVMLVFIAIAGFISYRISLKIHLSRDL